MKKNLFTMMVPAIVTLSATACGNSAKATDADHERLGYNIEYSKDNSGKQQTRTLNLKNFSAVDLFGVVNMHYTQGSQYSVMVKAPARTLDLYNVYINGSTLTVSRKKDRNGKEKTEELNIYVTAPTLKTIDMSGVTKLYADAINTEELSVDASGVSYIDVKNIKCGKLYVDMSGAAKLFSTIQAKTAYIEGSGACETNLSVRADNMYAELSGACNNTISFKGEKMYIESSGAGKTKANVDCKQLDVESSGAAKVTLSGTADKTKIERNGVSKVDTKELNKF